MKYEIVEKEAFAIVGVTKRFSGEGGIQLKEIPEFWGETCRNGNLKKIFELGQSGDSYGVCADYSDEDRSFDYMIGAAFCAANPPECFNFRTIPASKWAIFTARGALPDALQSTIAQVHSQFFGTEPFAPVDGPAIEFYPDGDTSSPDYLCEYWMPVIEK